MTETHGHGAGPLRGVRVLDASTMLAGPYTAGLLGDFGADVIKVEDVGDGDPMRRVSLHERGQALGSKITNRNKRSIAVDLRTDAGRDVFRRLAAEVDVVSTNFRASTLERWGLDYASLSADRPGLVMYHLSAFGNSGTRRDDPGFARVAEAYAGLTFASGEADGPPMFSGYAIADGVGGVHGAFAVMLALYERERTGRGQLVEASLVGAMLRLLEGFVSTYDGIGVSPTRTGNRNGIAPNGIYRTGDDRWIVLPASSPNMWPRLCAALGVDHLVADPRFVTNRDRVDHREELDAILQPELDRRTFAEIEAACRSAGCACGPVNSMADLFDDDDVWDQGALLRVPDPGLGREVTMPGIVPAMSVTPGEVRSVGPEPGEHTAEVLRDVLGLDDGEIRRLAEQGAISVGAPRD